MKYWKFQGFGRIFHQESITGGKVKSQGLILKRLEIWWQFAQDLTHMVCLQITKQEKFSDYIVIYCITCKDTTFVTIDIKSITTYCIELNFLFKEEDSFSVLHV